MQDINIYMHQNFMEMEAFQTVLLLSPREQSICCIFLTCEISKVTALCGFTCWRRIPSVPTMRCYPIFPFLEALGNTPIPTPTRAAAFSMCWVFVCAKAFVFSFGDWWLGVSLHISFGGGTLSNPKLIWFTPRSLSMLPLWTAGTSIFLVL